MEVTAVFVLFHDGVDSGNAQHAVGVVGDEHFVPACFDRSGLMHVYMRIGRRYRAFVWAKGRGDADEVCHGATCDEFDL